MAGLLDALSVAARALDAQRFGLAVTGQNTANVNTPGYTRRVADLRAIAPAEPHGIGRGVGVHGTRAVRDLSLERRLREETSTENRHTAEADSLAEVEAVIGLPGESVDADMDRFFDAFSELAEDPTSGALRGQVVAEGRTLTDAFHSTSGRLDEIGRAADRHVRTEIEEINELTAKIAELNGSQSGVRADEEPHDSRDATLLAIKELSEHLDVVALERQGGRGFDVYSLSGRSLVLGTNASTLSAVSTGISGFAEVVHDGVTVTGDVRNGSLAGHLNVRDTVVPEYTNRLDELAYVLVEEVNVLHDAGYDLNGLDAGNFFAPLATQAGAAAAIGVESAIVTDTALVAAAAVPSAGDNETARSIASLRDALVLDGSTSTLGEFWANLALDVGRAAKSADESVEQSGDSVRQIEGLRDAVSGVSLDEEALDLLRFQRAYEANAALFRAVDETLDVLMGMVR